MHKIARQQLNQEINDKLNSIGNKSNLNTNYKEDLVGAINEVNENVNNHTHDASDITSGIFDVARIPNLEGSKIISSVNHAENADKIGGMTAEDIMEKIYTIGGSMPVMVASNTLQESFDTERILPAAPSDSSSPSTMLVGKFIPKGTGEVRITFELAKVEHTTTSSEALISFNTYSLNNYPIYYPFDTEQMFTWRDPIGTVTSRGLRGGNLTTLAYVNNTTSYRSFDITLLVYESVPVYILLNQSREYHHNNYDGAKCRNIRIYYDVVK